MGWRVGRPWSLRVVYLRVTRFWGTRGRYSYAWNSLLKSDAMLIFGSDAPVETADPLAGLRAAVERPGWSDTSQTISRKDALKAYTCNAALAAGFRNFGSLEPGSKADFVALSADPMQAPLDEVQVLATALEGEFVFHAL